MSTVFYPSIVEVLPVSALPNELGFVKAGVTTLLSKIFYKNLQYAVNDRGDTAFYSLSIVSRGRIDIEIPGTGLVLILNPSHDESDVNAISEFPVTVNYEWPILGYLRNFDLSSFSFAPGDLFDLALAILDVTEAQLLDRALNIFITGATPINTFVDDVNSQFGTTIPYPTTGDPIAEVLQDIENESGINGAGPAIFTIYLLDALSEGNTEDRIKEFFSSFYGGDINEYIKNLLIPKIDAALKVEIAIEFPRNILTPLDGVGGEPLADTNIKTLLKFNAGELFFSTERGIGFDGEIQAILDHPSQIGNTGLGIYFDLVKLDISRTENIPEADADGRPADFVGVYIKEASITFPQFWNHDGGASTGVIVGKEMIIGSGGFTGTIALEAIAAGELAPLVRLKFGEDFQVSLDRFAMSFKQNSITGSLIEGTIRIPGFLDSNDNPADIRIKVDIHDDGDFDITAYEDDGFKDIKFGNVFSIKVKTIFFGKEDDDFYFGISGCIKFLNQALSNLLSGDICVEKLKIWSDGRIEVEGGTLPLPEGASIDIGPAKIAITAIHFGSHQQDHNGVLRKYRYFGFDGGLSFNPGGVDARGDGIKFYYSVDDLSLHTFLRIQSISLDLIIPGSASKDTATALISGYLAIKEAGSGTEYEGGVKFSLPKAQIAGGASMKYAPDEPSWIVDAFVELAAPLPLGATGLGIYGFRGLIGHRYVASKDVTGSETWFEYYKAPPEEGVVVAKFKTPDQTESDSNPFSIGAGISLATTPDNGKAFSLKLFLLLSLPEVFYLEGKANVLGKRVGLTGDDPQFFAYLAISPSSVETGFGADYKLPDSGLILKLYAEIQAGFFFDDPKAWYINFGTEDKRIEARLLSLFNASSYLMLSASGIKGGGGVDYGFEKSYAGGAVRASAEVYIEVGGFISFERSQIGGFALVGGHVDAYFLFIGFHISIDTSLSVEAPKPFTIRGSVRLCVGVTIGFWRFKKRIEKCFDVEFIWEKEQDVNIDPVIPMTFIQSEVAERPPLKGVNMISGEDFDLHYFGTSIPSANSSAYNNAVIPLDTWIDIEFTKGLLPADVSSKIGGFANTYDNYQEQIPPDPNARSVTHQYSIRDIEIKAWSGSAWVDYHPFEAMASPDALAALAADPPDYYYGQWQLMGTTHNKIRLLGETAFSFLQQGDYTGPSPEQFGITSATLFCETQLREKHCLRWSDPPRNTIYYRGQWYQINGIFFRIVHKDGKIVDWNSHYGIPRSVMFDYEAIMQIVFAEPCVDVDLKLTTFTNAVDIKFYSRKRVNGADVYTLEDTITKTRYQLLAPVLYSESEHPIGKVTIHPHHPDSDVLIELKEKCDYIKRKYYENKEKDPKLWEEYLECQKLIDSYIRKYCDGKGFDIEVLLEILDGLNGEHEECKNELEELVNQRDKACEECENIQNDFEQCFTVVPSHLSYEIYNEIDDDGVNEYRFRIWDNEVGEVILSSSTRYYDKTTALAEMWISLNLALDSKNYKKKTSKDRKYYFSIIDSRREVVARRIELFSNGKARKLSIDRLIFLLQKSVDGGLVVIPSIDSDLSDCPVCIENLECWMTFGKTQLALPKSQKLALLGTNKCNTYIQSILDEREKFCREYTKLYYNLYYCNLGLVQKCKDRCDELTDQVNDQQDHCEDLRDLIDGIRTIIKIIEKGGIIRPPRGTKCVTLVHEVCCLTLKDHEFNINVPGQDALEESYLNTVDAIETMLKPIWRPDTKYYVRLKIEDEVWRDPANKINHDRSYFFGFRTAGPVGYFHKDPHADYVDAGDDTDQYALTSLRPYIDYKRSYPNADGNLILAKPLFYEDARILLFYVDRYAYHMFGDWPAYNGLPAYEDARLQIVVKDPVEGTTLENPAPPDVVTTEIPEAIESWVSDNDPRIPPDIRALLNMRNPELLNPDFVGGECWVSGGDMIRPASVFTEVTLKYLKPLKLYTALINNLYRGGSEQVHRYVFQTSRYADFTNQINSYILDDGKGNTKDAIFQMELDITNAEIDLGYDVIVNNLSAAHQPLIPTFADPFDRILEGAWKLPPLDAAISTEFNVLRQAGTNKVIAIWIRNPEPFNDPKIPESDLESGISVLNGSVPNSAYKLLYSKDRSQAMIMNTSRNITAGSLNFRFIYLEWNGNDRVYDDKVVMNIGPISLMP